MGKHVYISAEEDALGHCLDMLVSRGFDVTAFPMIKTVLHHNIPSLKSILERVKIDYLLLTSRNAVRGLVDYLNYNTVSFDFSNTCVAVSGEKTAKLCKIFDIPVTHVPDVYTSDTMAQLVLKKNLKEKVVLYLCSSLAQNDWEMNFVNSDAKFHKIEIYDTVINENSEIRKKLTNSKPDLFAFTSPSNFRNYLKNMKMSTKQCQRYFDKRVIAAIGTTTKTAIESYGLHCDIVPKIFTLKDLTTAIINYFKLEGVYNGK